MNTPFCTTSRRALPFRNLQFVQALLLVFALVWSTALKADAFTWVGGEAGTWNTASNWIPVGVPSLTDTVYLNLNTVNGGGTGITLLSTRQIGHLEVSGSCPLPFRIGGGLFTGIQIVGGDFLAQPGMDFTELLLQFRGGQNRLRTGGNPLQTFSANNASIVTLQDDLTTIQGLECIGARLDLQGHNLTTPDVYMTRSLDLDSILVGAAGSVINIVDGAFMGPSILLGGWFNLDGATVYTNTFEFEGNGYLGNAQIHCDRFFTTFSLSAAGLDPGTSTLFVRYRDGGTDPNEEQVQVRDGKLNRVVFEADTFTAFALMGDTINEVVFNPGVVVERLVVRDYRFGSDSLHIQTLELADGVVVKTPFNFDVRLTLGAVDVCTDMVTFQNFGVSGPGSYEAGASSTDLGGNTGWAFTDCSTSAPCADAPDGLLALNGPGGVTMSWNPLPDAVGYRVRGRPLGGSSWRFLPGVVPAGPAPSALAPAGALSAGTYQWQVIAACSPDYSLRSPFSATATFFWPGPRLAGEHTSTMRAFPVPAATSMNIEGLVLEQSFQIENLLGQTLHHGLPNSLGQASIDVAGWPAGSYVLRQGGRHQVLLVGR